MDSSFIRGIDLSGEYTDRYEFHRFFKEKTLMFNGSEIFEKHYHDYLEQIARVDMASVKDRLGIEIDNGQICVQLFQEKYWISKNGIKNSSGIRPNYGLCVILAKYLLLCPDQEHHDPEWVSFRDFKQTSHFTNVNFFASDTEQAILKRYRGRCDELAHACEELGGSQPGNDMPYDLAYEIKILPRISLLVLFNDQDDEFDAQCTVLFHKHAEFYLDPESLVMTGSLLAHRLKKADELT